MAIRAGRVGVRPDQVDDTGKIIFPEGSGPGGDSYTKAEADAKFATKSALSSGLATKANAANVYSKTAADEKFSTQTALAELAQNTQEALADKADAEDVYDKEAADAKFATAEALETLAGDVEDKADADDVYTKTTADEKFATVTALGLKADQNNLTANNNNFIFAYDSATQKYGYKAGGADTFHPFNEGSGGGGFDVSATPDCFEYRQLRAVEDEYTVDIDQTPKFIINTHAASASTNAPSSYTLIYDVANGKARLIKYNKSSTSGTTELLEGNHISEYIDIYTNFIIVKSAMLVAGVNTISIYY